MVAKKVILLVILALLLIFIAQNTQVVTVRFLFWKMSMSQVVLIPALVVIGIAIGFLIHWRLNRGSRKPPPSPDSKTVK